MKKTMLRWISLPALFIISAPYVFAASGDIHVVKNNEINVRTGPGENFKVITRLNQNTEVEEVARLRDWIAVVLPGTDKNGWIHSSVLTDGKTQAPTPARAVSPTQSKISIKPVAEPARAADAEVAKKPAPMMTADAETLLQQGIDQYKQENFVEASEILKKAREQAPNSSSAAFFLGLTYKQMMEYPLAAENLRDAVTLVPHIKEALVELIEVLYRSVTEGSLDEAKKWIEVADKENIMPAKVTFLKGLVAQKEGRSEEAIQHFEKAKEMNPSFAQSADFQVALTLIKDRDLKQAQERLKAAILHDPQSDLASFARQYQDMVEKRIELEKPLRLTFGLFENYNTNLNAAPSNPQRYNNGIDEEESLGTILSFRANYTPILKDPWLFSASYAFSSSFNENLSTTYDSVSNSFSIIPGYNFGRYSLNLATSYDHARKKYGLENGVDLDPIYRDYLGTFKIGPLVRVLASQSHMLEFYGGYVNNEYFQPAISTPNAQGVQSDDRDSDGQSFYASWIWLFKENAFFNLKYQYTNDNTVGTDWDSKSHAFSANLVYPLLEKVKLQLGGQYTNQNFQYESTELDFLTNTQTTKGRSDDLYAGSIGLTWDFWKNTTLITQYSHTKADSTIGVYDYASDLYSVGLEYRY